MIYRKNNITASYPKEHENEGVYNGLEEAETSGDCRDGEAEQGELSPERKEKIRTDFEP